MLSKKRKNGPDQTDIKGVKYGMLTAIRPSHRGANSNKPWYWIFKCDCGNEKIIRKAAVTNGHVVSCGCYAKKLRKENLIGITKDTAPATLLKEASELLTRIVKGEAAAINEAKVWLTKPRNTETKRKSE